MPTYYAKYAPAQDGRRKLQPEQYEEVREHYKQSHSQRKTAAAFGISRRLVMFITQPEKMAEHRQKRIENKVWLAYYDKVKHTEAIAKYRAKKKELGIKTIKPKNS